LAEQIPDQQGRLRYIDLAVPGAGIDPAYTQDAATRWRLKSFLIEIVTSADVASRYPSLIVTVGGILTASFPLHEAISASKARILCWANQGSETQNVANGTMTGFLPGDYLVNNLAVISLDTVALQAADQYDAGRLVVEEWIEPLV